MTRRAALLCLAVILTHGAGTVRSAAAEPPFFKHPPVARADAAVVGQILVMFNDADVRPDYFPGALERDYSITLIESRRINSIEVHCALFALKNDRDRRALISQLNADPRVWRAQPVFVHRVAGMPAKDPYFDLQVRTRAGGVMSLLQRGTGHRVRIAVIDTGVDAGHPDLEGQIAESRNFVSGDDTAIPVEYHGTAVTGLISARPGNGVGIHGLAPNAELYALRACWEPRYGFGLCSTYTLAQALDYAIEVRARIINLSLAGPDDPLLTRLVGEAIEFGAVIFGAVGEEKTQSFPASIPGVIAVEQGHRSDMSVPGERVRIPGQQLLTTVPEGRYDFVSGSSFATAHASGVAAVMLEQQPHLKAPQLTEWLRRLHKDTAGR